MGSFSLKEFSTIAFDDGPYTVVIDQTVKRVRRIRALVKL